MFGVYFIAMLPKTQTDQKQRKIHLRELLF